MKFAQGNCKLAAMYIECIKMHTVPSRNLFSKKKGKNRGYHEVKTLHKRGKFSNSMHTIRRRFMIIGNQICILL